MVVTSRLYYHIVYYTSSLKVSTTWLTVINCVQDFLLSQLLLSSCASLFLVWLFCIRYDNVLVTHHELKLLKSNSNV